MEAARPIFVAPLLGLAAGAQAPLLVWFGGLERGVAWQAIAIGAALGLLVDQAWRVRRVLPCKTDMALVMVSLGGLGMLGGWIAGAGFRPLGAEGVCPLCSSVAAGDPAIAFGSLLQVGGMVAGMLALSLPAGVAWTRCALRARRCRALWISTHVFGNAGMLLGMGVLGAAGAPALARGLGSEPGGAHLAMLAGMMGGMLAAQWGAERIAVMVSSEARRALREALPA